MALPEEGAPERPVRQLRRTKPRRQKWARADIKPLTREQISDVESAAQRKLLMRMRRMRAEVEYEALPPEAQAAWHGCAFPAMIEPWRYHRPKRPPAAKGAKGAKGNGQKQRQVRPGKCGKGQPSSAAASKEEQEEKEAESAPLPAFALMATDGRTDGLPWGDEDEAARREASAEIDRSILLAGVPPLQLGSTFPRARSPDFSLTVLMIPSLFHPCSRSSIVCTSMSHFALVLALDLLALACGSARRHLAGGL